MDYMAKLKMASELAYVEDDEEDIRFVDGEVFGNGPRAKQIRALMADPEALEQAYHAYEAEQNEKRAARKAYAQSHSIEKLWEEHKVLKAKVAALERGNQGGQGNQGRGPRPEPADAPT